MAEMEVDPPSVTVLGREEEDEEHIRTKLVGVITESWNHCLTSNSMPTHHIPFLAYISNPTGLHVDIRQGRRWMLFDLLMEVAKRLESPYFYTHSIPVMRHGDRSIFRATISTHNNTNDMLPLTPDGVWKERESMRTLIEGYNAQRLAEIAKF